MTSAHNFHGFHFVCLSFRLPCPRFWCCSHTCSCLLVLLLLLFLFIDHSRCLFGSNLILCKLNCSYAWQSNCENTDIHTHACVCMFIYLFLKLYAHAYFHLPYFVDLHNCHLEWEIPYLRIYHSGTHLRRCEQNKPLVRYFSDALEYFGLLFFSFSC